MLNGNVWWIGMYLLRMCWKFQVDIFKIDRVMTRNMSKTATFHVISALWHGFPILFYRIWCLKKCYGHFSRSLRTCLLRMCWKFQVDIFKIDRVMTRNMSKTATFHVISALWHGFPIFFYRIWCLKKCYGHFSRSLRKSGKPCRYCIPISYFWLTYLLDLYDLVIWDDLDLY